MGLKPQVASLITLLFLFGLALPAPSAVAQQGCLSARTCAEARKHCMGRSWMPVNHCDLFYQRCMQTGEFIGSRCHWTGLIRR